MIHSRLFCGPEEANLTQRSILLLPCSAHWHLCCSELCPVTSSLANLHLNPATLSLLPSTSGGSPEWLHSAFFLSASFNLPHLPMLAIISRPHLLVVHLAIVFPKIKMRFYNVVG